MDPHRSSFPLPHGSRRERFPGSDIVSPVCFPWRRASRLGPSPRIRITLLAGIAASWLLLACSNESAPIGPRPLSPDELALLEAEGRVSKWLPTRFSAEIENRNSGLTITHVTLLVHGRRIERSARIAPGESRRIAVQYLFPEDPDFGSIDPETVTWELSGASGTLDPR